MKPGPALAVSLASAARMVARVAEGSSLAAELERSAKDPDAAPRAALIDLTHGTLRRYGRVQAIVRMLSRRATSDVLLEALLWCTLYALESGRYAEYTAVDQAVKACGLLEKWHGRGYVNGVLRGYLRQRDSLQARLAESPAARYQHPPWWIEALRAAYPEQWEEILAQGNSHPPMCLRINRQRTSMAAYLARLAACGIRGREIGAAGILLDEPLPVERLPGFDEGQVSVQDAGAQRAADCLELAAGQRVLDACAAPGGKTAHILETAKVELTALDEDRARCTRVEANLARLGLKASVRAADCRQLSAWWDGKRFDRVLADVPCSASGVVRRHPDIKWLRRVEDIERFAERQAGILDALWQVLAADGKLLYVTCSVFPRENDDVVSAFLARAAGARREPLADRLAAQWLPDAQHDGFYYALISKQA